MYGSHCDNSFLHCPGNWASIWRLKVPLKVKNLLWRICLVADVCRRMQGCWTVNCPSTCAMCEESYEDATRVLFDCPKARNVWLNCSIVDRVNSVMLGNNTAAEITSVLLQELTKEKAE